MQEITWQGFIKIKKIKKKKKGRRRRKKT